MKNKIFFVLVVGFSAVLVIPLITNVSFASPQGNSFDPSGAIGHINEAQAALQNGDTEGANNHLELAKQSLEGGRTGIHGIPFNGTFQP
ncbi:MAG: hypothetical protein ACRD8W_21595 [Nitrososphaeraceae archaeon]